MSNGAAKLLSDGAVAEKLPGFELRPQQIAMAEAVSDAFQAGEHLVVEAGTGVGKSFAYLVPAIERVIKLGGRVVISTHTIALQEQLVRKDIPFLQTVFGNAFSAVLVKGRSNYLGIRRLQRASAFARDLFGSMEEISELARIQNWAYETEDGTLADLNPQPDMRVWERARSDGDDCLGRKCPHYSKCFYQQARKEAAKAQLLIVNHALLFADLALRQGGNQILPNYDYLVLDEAHTVENVAGEHLGVGISNLQVRYLLNSLAHERTGRGTLKLMPRNDLYAMVEEARSSQAAYFADLAEWYEAQEGWNGRLRQPPPVEQRVSSHLHSLSEGLRDVRKNAPDEEAQSALHGASERCENLAADLACWHQHGSADWVYWMEFGGPRTHRMTLAARPLDVGPYLKEFLFDKRKSVILTSATLATDRADGFDYIKSRLCLGAPKCLSLGSPFNYREQLVVHVESGLPDPAKTYEFTRAAGEAIKKYVAQSAGRAFVLFTSHDMLNRCADQLRDFFASAGMTLLVQGAGMPRSHMLDVFRSTPRCVLFGAETFWAGVDVPGEALSNVIIVKLPFGAPNHPVTEARIESIRAHGGNPFTDYQVPEAVLKFKQGVGRLIRTKTDKGIVVILDPRIRTKPYGKRFLEALPDCQVIVS